MNSTTFEMSLTPVLLIAAQKPTSPEVRVGPDSDMAKFAEIRQSHRMSCRVRPPAGPSQSDGITVKLKATIIVAALLAATAAHAETIHLKCWARGLTGGQRDSVYINGEQVTVNLDEGTM